jgi:hypothetical protein
VFNAIGVTWLIIVGVGRGTKSIVGIRNFILRRIQVIKRRKIDNQHPFPRLTPFFICHHFISIAKILFLEKILEEHLPPLASLQRSYVYDQ